MAENAGLVDKAKAGVKSSLEAMKSVVARREKSAKKEDGKVARPRKATGDASAESGSAADEAVRLAREARVVDPDDREMATLVIQMRRSEENYKQATIQTKNIFLRKFELELLPEEEEAVARALASIRNKKRETTMGKEKYTVAEDTTVDYGGQKYEVKKGSYTRDQMFADAPVNLSFDREGLLTTFEKSKGVARESSLQKSEEKAPRKASAPKKAKAASKKK